MHRAFLLAGGLLCGAAVLAAQPPQPVTPSTTPGPGALPFTWGVDTSADLPPGPHRLGLCMSAWDTGVIWCWSDGGVWSAQPGGGGGGTGTVTSVTASAIPWLAIANPTTAAALSPATGQAAGRVLGTCGAGTSVSLCLLTAGMVPALSYIPFTLDGDGVDWDSSINGGTHLWNITGGIFATSNGAGGFRFNDTTGDGILLESAGGGIDFKDPGNGMLLNALNTSSPGSAGSDITLEGDYLEFLTYLGQASTAPHDRHILLKSGTGPITLDASTGAGGVTLKAGSGGISLQGPVTISSTFTGNVTGNVSGTAANVTGTVAVANGGTGVTSLPACIDTGGNHLNFNAGVWSCGSSGGAAGLSNPLANGSASTPGLYFLDSGGTEKPGFYDDGSHRVVFVTSGTNLFTFDGNNGIFVMGSGGQIRVTSGDSLGSPDLNWFRSAASEWTAGNTSGGNSGVVDKYTRFVPQSAAPYTCASGTEGAIYFNSTSHIHCMCTCPAGVCTWSGLGGLAGSC